MNMQTDILNSWVENENLIPIKFKKAVHIILLAISLDSDLSRVMVMKGGLLLGIKYGSQRYTTDIDFSNGNPLSDNDIEYLEQKLSSLLSDAEAELLNGVICSVQSIKKFPKTDDCPFPSLTIKIGYADKKNNKQVSRLNEKKSSDVISIDYSFNEYTGSTESISLSDEYKITCYSLTSIIAEKFRSILQQEFRNRNRRQDVYDLYFIISNFSSNSDEEKNMVLQELIDKSAGKSIDSYLNKDGLDNEEIRRRSNHEYNDIKLEISGDLPDFDMAYTFINSYFKALPWKK